MWVRVPLSAHLISGIITYMPIQAYLILGITLLAFVGCVAYMFAQAWRQHPRTFYAGIGIKFVNGADESQKGIIEACEVLTTLLHEYYPDHADKLLKHLWIEFHGKEAVITSASIPDGRLYALDGEPRGLLMGTCDAIRPTMFSSVIYVAKVRQIYTKDGSLRTAGTTALFHEVVEHILPFVLTSDWNSAHAEQWKPLEKEMMKQYEMEIGHM